MEICLWHPFCFEFKFHPQPPKLCHAIVASISCRLSDFFSYRDQAIGEAMNGNQILAVRFPLVLSLDNNEGEKCFKIKGMTIGRRWGWGEEGGERKEELAK